MKIGVLVGGFVGDWTCAHAEVSVQGWVHKAPG